jgi:RNA polymerase sigma-70 factor (ECF subfamily)
MQLEEFKTNIISLRQKLLGVAQKMLQNREDAEDVVQETLLRLWNIRQRLANIENPQAFAMQTTKNICIDRLRTSKNTTQIDESFLQPNNETPHLQTERRDMISVVKQIVETLPELQKMIIRMRDIEGYELSEIAEITATQISAVRMNLSRARKKVKEKFEIITKR